MIGHIRHYIEHYFAPHPSQEVKELFVASGMLSFATGSVSLFEPIYLHSIGFSVPQILLFNAALYVLYFFLLPLGGRICRRHGYEHTMLFSSPFLVLWYISLYAIPWNNAFIGIALLSLVMQKILYWPGYHANFATWSSKQERGREVSNMAAVVGLASILAPTFGGFIVVFFGFKVLLLIVAALILLSNVPLLRTPELYVPQEFKYFSALIRPFKKSARRRTLAFLGFGEELITLVVWPIFMITIIANFASLGMIVSLAMFINVLVILYVGRMSDEGERSGVLRSGVLYSVASWVLRPIVSGAPGVFLMDTFYRISKNMLNVPLLSTIYDDAREGVVMETVIHFEMALALGKIIAATSAAMILWKFPNAWPTVFVLAGAFTALYALMPRKIPQS